MVLVCDFFRHGCTIRQTAVCIFTLVLIICSSGCVHTKPDVAQNDGYLKESRVAPIFLADMTARQNELLGIVAGEPLPKRAKLNIFRTLMHNPELFAVYDPLAMKANRAPEFTAKQRELVTLRVSWLYQGKYEWSQHYPKALEAGWTEHDIQRIKAGADTPGWSPLDRTLLQAADQLVEDAMLNDQTWSELREHFAVADIMTLITLVSHYHWGAMISKSFGIQPDRPVLGYDQPMPD